MIPVAPHLRLEINDRRIGMLSEFTERTDCDLVPVRSIGVNPPSAIIAGTLHYTVTLRRVLLDNVTVGGVATYMERAETANVNLFI